MTSDGTVVASVPAGGATDAAGNTNNDSTSTDHTVTYDTTAPTVVSIDRKSGDANPTNAGPLHWTVTFSEPVSGVDATNFGLVTDHTGVNKSATDLAAKLKLKPEDNPTAQSLKKGGDENVSHLKTLSGPAFDKAYIDHEVAYHQQVIDAMDKTLVPNAQNAELKALLVKVRPAFVAHLEHAKGLQGSLEAKGTAPHSQKAG